jgi:membrane protease YdiL (CAAX protease family)
MHETALSHVQPCATPETASQARRLSVAGAFVALWAGLGAALRLDANAYLVLGVPLAVGFQLLVARAPLRAAWVVDGPALQADRRTLALAGALALAPLLSLGDAIRLHRASIGAWAIAGAAGAVGAAYAFRCVPRGGLPRVLGAALVAALPGLAFFGLTALARHRTHGSWPSWPAMTLVTTLSFAQYVPISFALEEVVFRGVLGAYVLRGARTRAEVWAPVAALSTLWGLWHLPIAFARAPGLAAFASTAAALAVLHLVVGVALTGAWRRTGTLLAPALAHALIDAVRNGLA